MPHSPSKGHLNSHWYTHYVPMLVMMFIAGILSSMSVWADKLSDVRISINDIYMALLMCAWMLLFMGGWDGDRSAIWIGLISIMVIIYMIRVQLFVTPGHYITSMIPHHSMAILMSKRLLNREDMDSSSEIKLIPFAKRIIETQVTEIEEMKRLKKLP